MSSNDTINRFQQHYENVLVHDLASKLSISNSLEIPSIKKIIISSSVNFLPKQTRGMIQESYSIKRSTKKKSISASSSKTGSRSVGLKEKKHTEGTRSAGRDKILDIPAQVRSAFILITGQKPEERIFRVSRPGLNIRAGRLAALQVTLRRKSIYYFLDRLVTEILPNLKTDLTKPKDLTRKTGIIFPYRQSSSPSSWLEDGSNVRTTAGSHWDGHGNFHFGIKNLYSFREIEQNPVFTQLNGLNISIITTAKTDLEAQLLLSGFQLYFEEK